MERAQRHTPSLLLLLLLSTAPHTASQLSQQEEQQKHLHLDAHLLRQAERWRAERREKQSLPPREKRPPQGLGKSRKAPRIVSLKNLKKEPTPPPSPSPQATERDIEAQIREAERFGYLQAQVERCQQEQAENRKSLEEYRKVSAVRRALIEEQSKRLAGINSPAASPAATETPNIWKGSLAIIGAGIGMYLLFHQAEQQKINPWLTIVLIGGGGGAAIGTAIAWAFQ